ncbi:hypothetical protein DID80_02850 [Candidatus Marinamargulisbacteria bacterium SCGC AAA071-K20]|nr:hypothetical protein DID80_02850 [Candidatus Marinamargulisbacteria bacterium SCGC AAA071-K20]
MEAATPELVGLRRIPTWTTLNREVKQGENGCSVWNEGHARDTASFSLDEVHAGASMTRSNSMFLGGLTVKNIRQGQASYSWGEPSNESYFLGSFKDDAVSGLAEVFSEHNYRGVSFWFHATGVLSGGHLDKEMDNTLSIIVKGTSTEDIRRYNFRIQNITAMEFKTFFQVFKTNFVDFVINGTNHRSQFKELIILSEEDEIKPQVLDLTTCSHFQAEPDERFRAIKHRLDASLILFKTLPSI